MADRSYRHLIIKRTLPPVSYTSHGATGGPDRPKPPARDRQVHGERLKNEILVAREEAKARNDERTAVGLDAPLGATLDFRIEKGFELVLKSLESPASGIELLATRYDGDDLYATVFVPDGKMGYFLGKLDAYLTKIDKKSQQPKNTMLVNSIKQVRLAVLDSFWTDDKAAFPAEGQPLWWEVWLRSPQARVIATFQAAAAAAGMRLGLGGALIFPDRAVLLAFGTREQMAGSVEQLDTIAELRRSKETPYPFIRTSPEEQGMWVKDLADRLETADANAPVVCILDTGVNRAHPLLADSLAEDDLHAHVPDWETNDHHGHGTSMAGVALFGDDLVELLLSKDPILLSHRLESVKILPPDGANDRDLYGLITEQSVYRAEIQAPHRKRVVCLAVTDLVDRDRGRPSSWSAAIDRLAMGFEDNNQRLFLISAGNLEVLRGGLYPDQNESESIHNPAQSWNAVTVGAYTERCHVEEAEYDGYKVVAPPGDLAPSSSTSLTWRDSAPYKPDIVLEGGNAITDGILIDTPESLSLLTTYHDLDEKLFVGFGDTSGATAIAARMAAVIQGLYPGFWPETVRALLIHSASWTPAMLARAKKRNRTRTDIARYLLRTYGHGVPNLGQALWSAKNDLTLIVQDEIQPFEKDASKEMHIHALPWPIQDLLALEDTPVEMRVTLSYFIEPKPGNRIGVQRHLYASHNLRFDIKTATESPGNFVKRLNREALAEEEKRPKTPENASSGWELGATMRFNGSIHSDTWRGTAADLARRGVLAVYPVIGWWRSNKLARWEHKVRYSLIVSIRTPETKVDLYTAVSSQIPIETAVPTDHDT